MSILGISGPPLNALISYIDGVSYVHKGNFEKHIKSGSLHDWAKRKDASVPETKRDAVPKQGPLTQFVTDAAENKLY